MSETTRNSDLLELGVDEYAEMYDKSAKTRKSSKKEENEEV